jgi:Serine dehydratase beta chain
MMQVWHRSRSAPVRNRSRRNRAVGSEGKPLNHPYFGCGRDADVDATGRLHYACGLCGSLRCMTSTATPTPWRRYSPAHVVDDVLFRHATPRSDVELVTRISPPERWSEVLAVGLEDTRSDDVDPATVEARVASVGREGSIRILGRHAVAFCEDEDVEFRGRERLPGHPNAMRMHALDATASELCSRTHFSVGGGIHRGGGRARETRVPGVPGAAVPFQEQRGASGSVRARGASNQRRHDRQRAVRTDRGRDQDRAGEDLGRDAGMRAPRLRPGRASRLVALSRSRASSETRLPRSRPSRRRGSHCAATDAIGSPSTP